MGRIDTSIKGFADRVIKVTEEQFEDLCALNLQCGSEGKYIPVFNMVVLLRILGVLPKEMLIDEPKQDLSEYERKFGVRIQEE